PPKIAELGHVGIHCRDIAEQLDFYTRVLGLTVTDHSESLGIWFLSARPDTEHHEVLLATGRDVPRDGRLIQQLSFRCDSLESVVGFLRRFREGGVPVEMVVSHGNAVGVYFRDPEGNRCEVYWQTGLTARQPFVEHIELDTDLDGLLERIRASVEAYGAVGYTEPSYVARTADRNSAGAGEM
ncbi:MAG: VOC family protein, partial [Actinomadura sp.]